MSFDISALSSRFTVRQLTESDVPAMLASINKGTRGSAGRKCPHTASKPLRIHKVFPAGFF